MTSYYLSGPMRGKPGHNHEMFNEVEDTLNSEACLAGDTVLNPAANFGGDKTRDTNEYMLCDLKMVLAADIVVLLPGWDKSEGAQREVQLAKWTGKAFWLAVPDLTVNDGVRAWRFELVDNPVPDPSPRASVLDEARQLITGDRNNAYGPPTQDFDRTAAMASAFGFMVNGQPLKGHHVAVFMILLKVSRLAWTPGKRDSWTDAAGYAGCGYECSVEESE